MIRSRASAFDSTASEYDSWFLDKGKVVFAIETQAFEEALPLLPKPWLEIGVGSGRFAQALGIENGLDLSIELLKMARNRGVNTFLGRGEATPFRSDIFGAVFLIATLCFVDSSLKVLMEANRLLRKGGRIVFGLVLRESPWGQSYEMKKEAGHHLYKHATFYSYTELETHLTQTGFSTEKVISTLFQKPDEVEHMEAPQEGFSPDAGFTVVVARKNQAREHAWKGEE
jgi:SAM-dependent methyltransferase